MKNELQEGDVLFQVNTNETDEITTLTDNTRIVGQGDGGDNTDVGWFSLAILKAFIVGQLSYETTDHKVTSLTNQSTDAQYPSAKCVFDSLQIKKDRQFEADQLHNGIWLCNKRQSTLVIEDLSATATIPVGGALSSGELNVEHILVLNNISSGDISIVLSKNVGVDWMRAEAYRFSIKAGRTCELRCYITREEINEKPGLVANIRIFKDRNLY